MFSALYFTYDGKFSGEYGLLIADFNHETVEETVVFSPTLNTTKPPRLDRFFHNGITYEEAPQHQFSLVSEAPISDLMRREVITWLVGSNEYRPLVVHQEDLEQYHYNCVFTELSLINVNGVCHGFRVTANFDSPYARGTDQVIQLSTGNTTVYNKSDIVYGYVYPKLKFSSALKIVNHDDDDRTFQFTDPQRTITVDNELKIIIGGTTGTLTKFTSKNWFRLVPGKNSLTVTGNAELTIPTYVKIGF